MSKMPEHKKPEHKNIVPLNANALQESDYEENLSSQDSNQSSAYRAQFPLPPLTQKSSKNLVGPLLGLVAACLWMGGAVAYLVGVHGLSSLMSMPVLRLTALAFFVLGPAFLLLACFWMLGMVMHLQRFGHDLHDAIFRLSRPGDAFRQDMQSLAHTVEQETQRLENLMEACSHTLLSMEEKVRHYGEALNETSDRAARRSLEVVDHLKTERTAMADMIGLLDSTADRAAESLTEKTKNISKTAEETRRHSEAFAHMLEGARTDMEELHQSLEGYQNHVSALHQNLQQERQAFEGGLEKQADYAETFVNRVDSSIADLGETLDKVSQQVEGKLSSGLEQVRLYADTAEDQARRMSIMGENRLRRLHEGAEKIGALNEHLRQSSLQAKTELSGFNTTIHESLEGLVDATHAIYEQTESINLAFEDRMRRSYESLQALAQRAELKNKRHNGVSSGQEKSPQPEFGQEQSRPSQRNIKISGKEVFQNTPSAQGEGQKSQGTGFQKTKPSNPSPESVPQSLAWLENMPPLQSRERLAQVKNTASVSDKTSGNGHADLTFSSSGLSEGKVNMRHGPSFSGKPWLWKDVLESLNKDDNTHVGGGKASNRVLDLLEELRYPSKQALSSEDASQAAAARYGYGPQAMREVTRKAAPGAVQALIKVLSDKPDMALKVCDFLREQNELIDKALEDKDLLTLVMQSETGRAYLLCDASLSAV